MKRSNWMWFAASGVLAILAGVAAILALRWMADRGQPEVPPPRQAVVVARTPIGANSLIRADLVTLEERDEIPSGAINEVASVVGTVALRDISQGEVLRVQDVQTEVDDMPVGWDLGNDQIAVALPADDVLSQWGAVAVGDHVDVLFTLDVILETPMYPEEVLTLAEGETVQRIERDQSMDDVSVLVLQNLEVLRIIQEPQSQAPQEGRQVEEGEAEAIPTRRALILKVTPQDAVLLKYFRDSAGHIDLALRSPDNGTLFDVEPVNINYLIRRYGITLPEPLE